ncbi:MAG: hypothetical protein QOD73_503 [Solirubrobacteraceae bacterium]|nr:hypothetical protein [Solirubrobacteraceae bacterium]
MQKPIRFAGLASALVHDDEPPPSGAVSKEAARSGRGRRRAAAQAALGYFVAKYSALTCANFCHSSGSWSSAKQASTGQASTQASQSMHSSGSM